MAFDVETEARKQDARRRAMVIAPVSSAAMQNASSRRRARTMQDIVAKGMRMGMVAVAAIVGTFAWSLIVNPIGTTGLMLAIFATVAVLFALGVFPRNRVPDPALFAKAAPATLPAATDRWLDRRRRALPALAAPQLDAISARLAALEPQLASVAPNDPVASDLGRLLGQHLPELVDRYTRVPADQRRSLTNEGVSIEKRLVDGLSLVDGELARVSEQLAKGDRDAFLIQGRFLEARYGSEEIK